MLGKDFPSPASSSMVHAKSQTLKRRERARNRNEAAELALERYEHELALSPGLKRKGLRQITATVRAEFRRAGKPVSLSHVTVLNRKNGVPCITQARETSRNLTDEQSSALESYIITQAKWGWPANGRSVLQYANKLRMESGEEPITGVNWVDRWIEAHPNIHAFRPTAHESKRGRAANITNVQSWFQILGDVILARKQYEEYPDLDAPIDADCIYGMDESGFQPYGAGSGEKVFGPADQNQQYQQREGGRETITVLACICADGTALPPAVIFKGDDFQVQWDQENPLNAS